MGKEVSEEEQAKIKVMIDELISKAKKASEEYMKLTQEDVDRIVKAMSMAGLRTSHGTCKNGCRRNRKRNI